MSQVAQRQKQKAKEAAKQTGGETNRETVTTEDAPAAVRQDDTPSAEREKESDIGYECGISEGASQEPIPDVPRSELDPGVKETNEEISPPGSHRRQSSLSLQSKMRSSSFRQTSAPQIISPGHPFLAVKSPTLPPLSPEGDTMPEVWRKQARRVEEVERENRRLEKELEDAHARWKRSDEQLEDLREASGDVVELKDRMERAEKKAEEVEKLVSRSLPSLRNLLDSQFLGVTFTHPSM